MFITSSKSTMNLTALYQLLEACARSDGVIQLPSWDDIAKAANVHPSEDTMAFRALIEKGAVDRRPLGAATLGDYDYLIRRPVSAARDAFMVCLRTVGASVRHLDLERVG